MRAAIEDKQESLLVELSAAVVRGTTSDSERGKQEEAKWGRGGEGQFFGPTTTQHHTSRPQLVWAGCILVLTAIAS